MNKLVYSVNTDFKKDLTCFSNLNLQTDDLDVTNIKQMDGSNIYIKQTRNFKEHNIVKLHKNIVLNNVFIRNNVNIVSNIKIGATYIYFNNSVISKNINCINNKKKNFFYIRNNLNVNNLSVLHQENDMEIQKDYIISNENINNNTINDLAFYSNNNFLVDNNIIAKKDIHVVYNLSSDTLKFNVLNITNNVNIKGNLVSTGNFNTGNTIANTDIYVIKDMNVFDSINIHTDLFLPAQYDVKYKKGSIRYNDIKKLYECYLKDRWIPFSKKFNSTYDTGITYQPLYLLNNRNNIDIVQNNKLVMVIDNNNDLVNINKYNVNGNNSVLNIYNNLNIGDNIYNKYNSNIRESLNIEDGANIVNNSIFSVISNYNIIPNNNGIVRYNNKYNILELFVDKWKPFINIGNNINTSKIYLSPLEKDKIYDTIYFNSNHNNTLNINLLNTIIKSNHIIVNQNLNIKNNCINYNNVSEALKKNNKALNLNLDNFTIKKNNNFLVSKTAITNEDIICKSNISISSTFNLKNMSFLYYINDINIDYKYCNTIQNLFDNSIINNKLNFKSYNIENNFNLDTIIVYFNKTIYNTELFIKISDLITIQKTVNNVNYVIFDIYDTINTNDLYLSVKTDKIDKNIHMKLNVKGSYNIYGQLQREHSNIYINELENFNTENRIFYNIVNIGNNLNLYTYNNNYSKLNLLINKQLIIGNENINDNINNICNISNNYKHILKYNNNFTFFSNINKINDDNKSLILVDSNEIVENIIVDKNLTNTNNINIYGNTNIKNNLNIKNTLIFSNKDLNINFEINNSNNLISLYNVNVLNNLNIDNNINTNNYIKNNIIIKNNDNIFKIIENRNLSIYNNQILEFPILNNNNNIYLNDKSNIIFKYKNKDIINIDKNCLSINIEKNTNNIISSNNFILNSNEFKSNSEDFYINNTNLYKELKNIEKHYYTIYNINITPKTNQIFGITYNYPRINMDYNLNYHNNNNQKKIEYIAYQFCNNHVDSHIHNNWNNNSFIMYKPIDNINFNNNVVVNHNINYPKYNFSNFNNITSNIFTEKYDFYQVNMSFNINLGKNKYQLVGNENIFNSADFILKKTNLSKYTLRLYPVYNNNSNIYVYYSDLIYLVIS